MQIRNLIILIVLVAAGSTTSCKKKSRNNDKETPVPIVYSDYAALKQGNYWIYERYHTDGNGNVTVGNVYDSLYMAKDTTINGMVYHTYMWNSYPGDPYIPQYLRDSAHYVINQKGEVVFSSLDFTNNFLSYYYYDPQVAPDTVAFVVHHMADKDFLKSTPAGVFKTSAFKKDYHMFPPFDRYGKVRSFTYRYAEGVGLVSEILPWYLSVPYTVERRLVRYHVAK